MSDQILDLRLARPEDAASVAYGILPLGLMEDIRVKFMALLKEQQAKVVARTE